MCGLTLRCHEQMLTQSGVPVDAAVAALIADERAAWHAAQPGRERWSPGHELEVGASGRVPIGHLGTMPRGRDPRPAGAWAG